MKIKKWLLPIIILTLGVLAVVAAHLFSNVLRVPSVNEKEFPFSVAYKVNGEDKKIEGTYKATFKGCLADSYSPTQRFYEGVCLETNKEGSFEYTVEEKNGKKIVIYLELHADYLMGDPNYDDYYDDYPYEPRLIVFDEEGSELDDEESLSQFNVEIIGWQLPEPIENDLTFSGFGRISSDSVLPMILAAYATLLACVIFVKKDKELVPNSMDTATIVLNFIIGLAGAPFVALFALLTQIYTSGEELIYQIFYCIPAFMVLCVAASICLRRKGYSKSGFIVQLAGPAMFVLCAIIEPF